MATCEVKTVVYSFVTKDQKQTANKLTERINDEGKEGWEPFGNPTPIPTPNSGKGKSSFLVWFKKITE